MSVSVSFAVCADGSALCLSFKNWEVRFLEAPLDLESVKGDGAPGVSFIKRLYILIGFCNYKLRINLAIIITYKTWPPQRMIMPS